MCKKRPQDKENRNEREESCPWSVTREGSQSLPGGRKALEATRGLRVPNHKKISGAPQKRTAEREIQVLQIVLHW